MSELISFLEEQDKKVQKVKKATQRKKVSGGVGGDGGGCSTHLGPFRLSLCHGTTQCLAWVVLHRLTHCMSPEIHN